MSEIEVNLSVFLTKVQFFSDVARTLLSILSENIEVHPFYRNDPIVNRGNVGNAMYTILGGEVGVHECHQNFGKIGL